LMQLSRKGGLLAVGAQGLRWPGLPAHALSAVLDAVGVFCGYGKLGHDSSLLKVGCVRGMSGEESLQVTLTQHRHVSRRAYVTMPGAIGYDRGDRRIDTCEFRATLPKDPKVIVQLVNLYDRVQEGTELEQKQAFLHLCAQAGVPHDIETLLGGVVSQDAGVPINLLPSELWNRWMPKGVALETGWRTQSAQVAHTRQVVFPNAVEPKAAPSTCAPQGHYARGFTVHHDQARSMGPEGKRLCRIEGQVAQGQDGKPLLTLANHWSMDRANAQEVGAFILGPLHTLVGTHQGPLWGAGWRTSREATLSGAFTLEQLQKVANQVLRHGVAPSVDQRQNDALYAFAVAIESAVAVAERRGGWGERAPGTQDDDVDPLSMLADAVDRWTLQAHLWALPRLQGLLLDLDGKSQRTPLFVATDSDAYALPARLVRRLHLTHFKDAAARKRAAGVTRQRIDTCRALLASDPLVGPQQRDALERYFDLAQAWAAQLAQAA